MHADQKTTRLAGSEVIKLQDKAFMTVLEAFVRQAHTKKSSSKNVVLRMDLKRPIDHMQWRVRSDQLRNLRVQKFVLYPKAASQECNSDQTYSVILGQYDEHQCHVVLYFIPLRKQGEIDAALLRTNLIELANVPVWTLSANLGSLETVQLWRILLVGQRLSPVTGRDEPFAFSLRPFLSQLSVVQSDLVLPSVTSASAVKPAVARQLWLEAKQTSLPLPAENKKTDEEDGEAQSLARLGLLALDTWLNELTHPQLDSLIEKQPSLCMAAQQYSKPQLRTKQQKQALIRRVVEQGGVDVRSLRRLL